MKSSCGSEINFPYYIDTLGIKKYPEDKIKSPATITSEPRLLDIENFTEHDILIIEDVIEDGDTLTLGKSFLLGQKPPPKSVEICLLGRKKIKDQRKVKIKYCLFDDLGPEWLFGEGMDRNKLDRGREGIWQKTN